MNDVVQGIERILSFDNKYVYLPGMNISVGEQYKNALAETVTIVAGESPARQKQLLSDLHIC